MPGKQSSAIQQKIDKAIILHREGKWDEAEAIYRQVLRKSSRNVDALHLIGNLYFLRGDYETAEKWVKRALKALKRFPLALLTLAQIELRSAREEDAEKHLLKALEYDPSFYDGRLILARMYIQLGRNGEALQQYEACMASHPEDEVASFEYANALQALGRSDEAGAIHGKLKTNTHEDPNSVNNYAVQLLESKREREAQGILADLLSRHPNFAMGWSNLGLSYENLGEYDEAIKYYERALQADSGFIDACFNMGNVYFKREDLKSARHFFEKTMQRDAKYMPAYHALSRICMIEGDNKAAEDLLKQSIALKSEGNFFAYSTYATLLRDQQRFDESVEMCHQAFKADPSNSDTLNTLGWAYHDMGDYVSAQSAFRKGLSIDPGSRKLHSNLLMLLTYRMELGHQQLYDEHAAYGKQHEPENLEQLKPLAIDFRPYRRLKIGYVSPDFRRHVVRNFIQPIIAAHNRDKVEVYCYGEIEKEDDITAQIKGLSDHWINTYGMSALQMANRIREDQIDVLIELAGHSGSNRLDVIDYHPAPVQVSYLGYITTTGARGMDYRITDPIMNPPDSPELYSEKLYRLDRCYKCYEPSPHEPPLNPEVSPSGEVVFGSLHRISKLTDRTVALWSAVMCAVPRATLLLARHELHFEENRKGVLALFAKHGVPAERIILDDTYGYKTHMEIYKKIDIGLDPIPVVGGATTAEAMWMGVPVLTLQGEAFRERISSTLLDAVGLGDWIATSTEDYVSRAVRFANDYHLRLQLRANIRDMFQQSPLGDARGLATSLEDAYIDMWHQKIEENNA